MNYKGLKKARVLVALLFLILTTILFLDIYEKYTETRVQEILFFQFIPSLLKFIQTFAIGAVGFIIIIGLTIFVGRIYCSVICPLGIMQDVFGWIAKKRSKATFFFKKKKSYPILRYSLMAITVLALLFSFSTIVSILDPYSHFGRIVTYLLRPVIVMINNGTAEALHKYEIYSLNPVKLVSAPWLILLFTITTFMAIAYMSYKRGRLFCNTICPVGTCLGLISNVSFLKIRFDEDNCTKCGKCIGVCKSECIDLKTYAIDYTRCVDCFNCLAVCNDSALKIGVTKSKTQSEASGRRGVISAGLGLMLGQRLLAETKQSKGTLELLHNKKEYPVSPPGSLSIKRFNEICTACGLCVAICPTQVLQPAIGQYGLKGFMQPHMDYLDGGYCNFDCRSCSQVCPTGAILPIEIEEKQLTQLGKAVFVKENCVVYTDGTDCGACSEHCPTKAVNMVPYEGSLLIPEVDQSICIGCGACEHPCPLDGPYKAIYVNGNAVHQAADKPKDEASSAVPIEEDFPF